MYADINKGKGMTSLIKKMVPAVWRAHAQRLSRKITAVVNQLSSRERVFTRIYKRNVWGGRNGVFCSGDGSVDEAVVGPYVEMVAKLAHEERFLGELLPVSQTPSLGVMMKPEVANGKENLYPRVQA